MVIIGNILLAIATLILLALNTGSLAKAPPSNDGAVGYGWSIIILNLLLIAVMIIVSLIIGFRGGLDWVSPKKSTRFFIVAVALLTALFTSAISSFFRFEPGPVPMLIRAYSSFAPLLIPAILIGASFVLLNSHVRSALPVAAYQWPLIIVSVLGVTGTAAAVMGFLSESSRNRAAVMESNIRRDDENHQRMLAEIDSNDVMKNFVFLLVFTGDNQDPEIRTKSVAKVKTHPQWQQELIRLLQTDWAPEPFQFLASNEVDDPSLFQEPVREGVLIQARLIRERIRNASHPSHLYPEMFGYEIDRVLRTVDRFKGKGVDYLPAVKELRAALDERSDFDKPKFTVITKLDKWIKENN
jgi:hypothetical protein